MRDSATRREALSALGTAITFGVAGCVSAPSPDADSGPQTLDDGELPDPTPASERTGGEDGIYAEVYREAIDSVVLIRDRDPAGAQGSGFVYEGDYIVTNEHVVANVDGVRIQFSGDQWSTGTVVGDDVYSDLAVIEAEETPEFATSLPLTDDDPVVGQEVMALGNPLGLDASVSRGIISGVNRSLPSPTDFRIPNAIQTDASVNQGNSGGPLVDLDADVVGVINAGGGEGIGFAISAALTRRVVPALIEDGEFEHTYLGVLLTEVTPEIAEANDLERPTGVIVSEVLDDTPAEGVLQDSEEQTVDGVDLPVGGDVIVEIDGEPIPTQEDLSRILALDADPGDTLEFTIVRDGELLAVEITLDRRPDPR